MTKKRKPWGEIILIVGYILVFFIWIIAKAEAFNTNDLAKAVYEDNDTHSMMVPPQTITVLNPANKREVIGKFHKSILIIAKDRKQVEISIILNPDCQTAFKPASKNRDYTYSLTFRNNHVFDKECNAFQYTRNPSGCSESDRKPIKTVCTLSADHYRNIAELLYQYIKQAH